MIPSQQPLCRFSVPGVPVAKGRPRATTINGSARLYTPKRTAGYENLVRMACANAIHKPLEGALRVTMGIALPVPASWSKKRTEAALRGDERPAKKPDIDNYIKSVLDGMNSVVFVDDSQVVEITASKHYSEYPGVTVAVFSVFSGRG